MVSAEDVAALVLKHKGKNYVSKDVFADLGPGYFPIGTESAPKTVNLNNRVIFPVTLNSFYLSLAMSQLVINFKVTLCPRWVQV